MQVTEKIAAFRARMKDENFAAVIVPTADSHASEYIADYFKTRQWLSGFTGSAGTLVVGEKEAALFVDGRYFIQAERQIAGSGITLMRMGTAGTPKLEEYLAALLHENDALGVDFGVVSEKFAENMRETAAKCGALLRDTGDWFGDLWKDRPPMPQEKAFILDEQYAGQSVQSKVSAIRKAMAERGAQLHVLNVLDDIAWVLNVRGGDVLNTPVVMSYLVIGQKHVNWFVDETKVDDAMRKTLADEGVNVRGYDEIIPALKGLEPDVKVLADASRLTAALMNALEKAEIIRAENPSTMMKAVKNDVELDNLRRAHVKDGVAVTRLMYWLKQNVGKIPMTEISVSDKLLALRQEQEHFISPSFNTICAYRANAAMMHYSAKPGSAAELKPEGFLLVDSGGHYARGTTDVTRTIALGPITDEERRRSTQVLQGHIQLAMAEFPQGVMGENLDALARGPRWREGLDYDHGTGHGVGCVLSVHEAPPSFRWRIAEGLAHPALETGMVISDEPGYYAAGRFGIRHENLLLVQPAEAAGFLRFETLTLAPFDRDALDPALLTASERDWLNGYHRRVYAQIAPLVPTEVRQWLREVTAAL